ncbi:MAG: hypothetical protein GKC03_02495 [Methanomassiliicoccales archaeon]|nr:hypothetical protein [Methanomassiliicoccales archaeon]NYT14925.1 hypothetical protein [Methanomassiliicoccales archaeon]
MITIRCAKCKRRIFRYAKMKKVKVLHCWKDRIERDDSIRDGEKVLCHCGNQIGVDEGKWIKMKQGSFTYSGTVMNQ